MTAHAEPSPNPTRAASPQLRRVLLSSYLGASIEYYDFLVYSAAATVVFNRVFFSDLPPLTGQVVAFATLAAGYLARPIGAVLFGHYGDRLGRKSMLVLSMALMGVAGMLIGLIPARETIGVLAPVLLVLLRLVQGIAVGGEYGGASLMAVEHAGDRGRGFAAAVANAGAPTGSVLATLVLGLFALLPEADFLAWGWRIPFLLSGVLLGVGLWVRVRVAESPVFVEAQQRPADESRRAPLARVLGSPKALVLPFLVLLAPISFATLLNVVGLAISIQGGLSRPTALLLQALSSLVLVGAIIGFGRLSDRVGRRPVLTFGAIAGIVLVYPALWLLGSGSAPLVLLALVVGAGVVTGSLNGAAHSYVSERFATDVRYTGAALASQAAATVGAGLTPLLAGLVLLGSGGNGVAVVAAIAAGVCLVSLIAVRLSAETHQVGITALDPTLDPTAAPALDTTAEPVRGV